jgi:choline/glycine/proline betaine transport protein
VFGLAAIDIELNQGGGLVAQVNENVPVALFAFLAHFPWAPFTSGLSILIVVIFFATSADSASLVMDMLTSGDEPNPPVRQRVFWALSGGALSGSLLFLGGFKALQNVITTLGFPFCVLLVFMAYVMVKALRTDYAGQSL